MAEFFMTYENVVSFLDDCIEQSPDPEILREHKTEILAAVTARDESVRDERKAVEDSLQLWENQTSSPSELLLGSHYIVIRDIVIEFIRAASGSGFLGQLIQNVLSHENGIECDIGTGVTIGAAAVFFIMDTFKSVAALDDFDFCVYRQAVVHFARKDFTEEDMRKWFPGEEHLTCNMHDSRWDCTHLMEEDICDMLSQAADKQNDNLKQAIKSLLEKKILTVNYINGVEHYSFRT
ncbi:MAG: hypothetical protein LUG93_04780 [Lachnospiraceae bacterium]|nr:hypothetical protein [Lachnospiraceae bacterium]